MSTTFTDLESLTVTPADGIEFTVRVLPADAADALALAIAHGWRGTALGAAAGQTGLDTADLASRAGRSQFAAKAPARARPRGQLTAAQRAWLDAERSAGGGRRR